MMAGHRLERHSRCFVAPQIQIGLKVLLRDVAGVSQVAAREGWRTHS